MECWTLYRQARTCARTHTHTHTHTQSTQCTACEVADNNDVLRLRCHCPPLSNNFVHEQLRCRCLGRPLRSVRPLKTGYLYKFCTSEVQNLAKSYVSIKMRGKWYPEILGFCGCVLPLLALTAVNAFHELKH